MKKTFRIIGLLLCSVILCLPLTACGGNDDDDEPETPTTDARHDPALIGTWRATTIWEEGQNATLTYVFSKNGTMTYSMSIEFGSGHSYIMEENEANWSTKDGYLYISDEQGFDISELDPIPYTVKDNKLYLSDYDIVLDKVK